MGTSSDNKERGALSSPLSSADRAEILQSVREALGKFGSVGELSWAAPDSLELLLLHPQGRTRTNLGSWALSWAELSEENRKQRCLAVARELTQTRVLAAARQPRSAWSSWLPLFLWSAIALLLFYFLRTSGSFERWWASSAPSEESPPAPASSERALRAARVCEATRARVVRGATVHRTDAEGWVVEFMALRSLSAPTDFPEENLKHFLEDPTRAGGSKLLSASSPPALQNSDSDSLVEVQQEELRDLEGNQLALLRLSFHGGYVDPYFDEETRDSYYHLAHQLSEKLQATHSGLYARCASGVTHHLGSWFRGKTEADAARALLFILGTYADPPHIMSHFLKQEDGSWNRGRAWSALRSTQTPIDRALLAEQLGQQGGLVVGRSGEHITLVFPFRDGNRASRASRALARQLHLLDSP